MEIWKPIPGFEHCGEVSNLGRIKSKLGVIRKTIVAKTGYIRVGLKKLNGKNTNYVSVHRLVAKAFCEGFKEGLEVNHKNADKNDNTAENLEWVNRKNNIRHSYRLGLSKNSHRKPKIPHEDRELILTERAKGATFKELADRYNVHSSSMISYIKGRKRNRKTVIYELAQ